MHSRTSPRLTLFFEEKREWTIQNHPFPTISASSQQPLCEKNGASVNPLFGGLRSVGCFVPCELDTRDITACPT